VQIKDISAISYRRYLFGVTDYFLSKNGRCDASINYFIQCAQNEEKSLNEFHTLLIDLKQSSKDIWENIQVRSRTEILSFLNNQTYKHYLDTTFSKKELKEFIKHFNAFAEYKKIRKAEQERLYAYHRHGILGISTITQNNDLICVNFYRLTKERATNLHSFHLQHQLNGIYSQSHLGRAHRTLHWLDIQKFKGLAIGYYDFCGWYHGSTDTALLNINKFKEQFTRHKVIEYSGVIYTNKFLKFLKNLR
jgi:hypothetical protein